MQVKTLQTTPIYDGKVFSVRRDQVRLPNGALAQMEIIDHKPAVTILPIDENGHIWFIRQYRHAAGVVILELPAGTVNEGEEPILCASREIREEIGMSAGELKKIGDFYMAPGYTTEFLHAYLASDLKPDPLPGDEDELIQVERIPLEQAYALAEAGGIHDAKTLATLLLAKSFLFNPA